mmetsp:Transcript_126585/g.328785  ORF Transcript_126585/g.328785 Transcript_126585/m.328785 type:complete len:305 (+) Transcript_126585:137-1051(+)
MAALSLLSCGVIAAVVGNAAIEAAPSDAFLVAAPATPSLPSRLQRQFRDCASSSSSVAAAPSGVAAPPGTGVGAIFAASGLAAFFVLRAASLAPTSAPKRRGSHSGRCGAVVVAALNRAGRPVDPLFDPLGWAEEDTYEVSSNAELVLGRVAMLAAVGLPVSEIFHEDLAESAGLPSRLVEGGRSPMALNGGEFGAAAELLVATFLATLGVSYMTRTESSIAQSSKAENDDDVLNPRELSTPTSTVSPMLKTMFGSAERLNGRIAMVAISCMVIQELVTGQAVVDASPLFFGIHSAGVGGAAAP